MNVYRDRASSKRTTVSVFQLNVKFVLFPATTDVNSVGRGQRSRQRHPRRRRYPPALLHFDFIHFSKQDVCSLFKNKSLKLLLSGGPDD